MAPTRLGPLALEGRLGAGQSAAGGGAFRALHLEQRRPLAVKIFASPFGATLDARRDLALEWEQLKQLRHPHIARCFGGGFEDNAAYLAYELIDGTTLAAEIQRRGRLPWEVVLDYAEQLADALDTAHRAEIVHAGLEPDKIVIDADGQTRIVDFRADRWRSAFRSSQPSTPWQIAHRPPELVREPAAPTAKSDLYALGAVLYTALAGKPPFIGVTPAEVQRQVLEARPTKVAAEVLDCPVWFSALIDQLLEKAPAARPHSAAAVQLGLREVRQRTAAGTSVVDQASRGFTPLTVTADRDEARKLLGRQQAPARRRKTAPVWERPWFLLTALIGLVGLVTWLMWPLNDAQLAERARALLADGQAVQATAAKEVYLQQLLSKYPDSPHADWAREQIEQIDMNDAEAQLDRRERMGRPPGSEAARLYAAARRFERFGDSATALDQYQSLVTLLASTTDDAVRPYVNLAKRQVAAIKASGGTPREQLVREKLAEADRLQAAGSPIEARKLWDSIIELYGENRELQSLVQQAQDRRRNASEGTH
jgi:hypothetical protein